MTVDWTLTCQPYRHLRLERHRGYWIVVGADGDTVYIRTPDILTAVRFMRTFAVRHNATLDEPSISEGLEEAEIRAWVKAQRLGGDPVGVEPPHQGSVSQAVDGIEPASPPALSPEQAHALAVNRLIDQLRDDSFSRRVPPANVIPFPAPKESA